MTVGDLVDSNIFEVLVKADNRSRAVCGVFNSDMLSFVMGNGTPDYAWVTVMSNPNTIAVAVLVDMPCIVFASSSVVDELTIQRAKEQHVTLLRSNLPVFETSLEIHEMIKG